MTGSLKIISAGAGAGKTTRLSGEILEVIQTTSPEKIVATTFTKKAAEELIERIRLELLKSGETEAAASVLDGYVGTMNSVFGRLIEEFSLQLGLSPVQRLLEENEALALFNTIAHKFIAQYEKQNFLTLRRFQLLDQDNSWHKSVLSVLKLARENGIDAQQVKACATYSIREAEQWQKQLTLDSEAELTKLILAMKKVLIAIPKTDTTAATKTTIEKLENIISFYERNSFITWEHWAQASKLKPGAKSREAVAEVIQIGSVVAKLPLLHDDFKTVIEIVFHCASDAMELYEQEKKVRGFIDFTDQEYLALALLNNEQFVELLKERIEAVFVDEFQDSSPLQIALNMKLREIAKQATWVGDLKQAIYGFRGTDPDLMKTAMREISDIEQAVLSDSYRSRESLVHFTNELFTPVFEQVGLSADLIKLNPQRGDLDNPKKSLELWKIDGKNKTVEFQLIAKGIADVIKAKETYIVVDKESRLQRTLKPSDIAVLCRGNEDCKTLANELATLGVEVMLGGEGLLQTTETIYAISALRYLINKSDTLALAQILHLSSEQWQNGEWLSEWLDDPEFKEQLVVNHPFIKSLSNQREHISQMSPSEMLDFALVKGEVDIQVLRWGNGEQRLANLDRLRKLVQQYEHGATLNGYTATVGGLLLFLEDAKKDRDLNQRAESKNENAVNILTYHRSKGLEWPFVILSSLDKATISSRRPPEVFNRVLAISTTPFNVHNLLEGRMLYYWPWPFGKTVKDIGFDTFVQGSLQLKQREQQLKEESQRLLYVGMTRARDYLALTARDFGKASWLKEQVDATGAEIIAEINQVNDQEVELVVNEQLYKATFRILSVENDYEINERHKLPTFVGVNKKTSFELEYFKPSATKFAEDLDPMVIKKRIPNLRIESIGERVAITGRPEIVDLGIMVHTFLAVDSPQMEPEKRLQLAQMIQQNYSIHAITAENMLQASNNVRSFLVQHYPRQLATYNEYPIHLKLNGQKAAGIVDLLVELEDGWIIIDHKTFPGAPEKWVEKAIEFLPQLQIYTLAIEKASGKPVKEAWIHMPIVGQMVNFTAEMLKSSDEKVLVL